MPYCPSCYADQRKTDGVKGPVGTYETECHFCGHRYIYSGEFICKLAEEIRKIVDFDIANMTGKTPLMY